MLRCKSIVGDNAPSVLQADFAVNCFGGEHWESIIFVIIFLGLYVIGVPIGVFVLLWLHKKHLYDPSQPKHHKVRREFGTLFEQYEPKYWYCALKRRGEPRLQPESFPLLSISS